MHAGDGLRRNVGNSVALPGEPTCLLRQKLLASNKGFCAGATSLELAYLVSEGVDGKHASCTNRIYAAAAGLGNRVSYSFGNNLFGQLGLEMIKQIAPMVIDSLPQNEDVLYRCWLRSIGFCDNFRKTVYGWLWRPLPAWTWTFRQ